MRRQAGFSLVELLVVGAIGVAIAAISVPAIQKFLVRSKIEGFARSTASLVRQSRLEAIKRGRGTVLRVNTATGGGMAFVDDDQDNALDAGERVIGRLDMPGGVALRAPGTQPVIDGFSSGGGAAWIRFNVDGSVDRAGAIRVGDLPGNLLEVRVAPAATAKITVRKWDGSLVANGEGTHWYSKGEGSAAWSWQ